MTGSRARQEHAEKGLAARGFGGFMYFSSYWNMEAVLEEPDAYQACAPTIVKPNIQVAVNVHVWLSGSAVSMLLIFASVLTGGRPGQKHAKEGVGARYPERRADGSDAGDAYTAAGPGAVVQQHWLHRLVADPEALHKVTGLHEHGTHTPAHAHAPRASTRGRRLSLLPRVEVFDMPPP